jgi:F-type H+-transporting ATPase subunit gamma
MPSLKDLKVRIKSVKSTQKITKAMKVVAASKLRRAREAAEGSRPYAQAMERMVARLAAAAQGQSTAPKLLVGTGRSSNHLLIIATSDRGLCGAFNGSIVRAARKEIRKLMAEGKQVRIYTVGRKAQALLSAEFKNIMVGNIADIARKTVQFASAEQVAREVLEIIEVEQIDVVSIVYNHFKSAISQVVTWQQLMPMEVVDTNAAAANDAAYEFEPGQEEILASLLPKNFTMQIFKALLESAASEQGARMNAMENATKNAGEMIKKLSLKYNRTRQANITKELIEIISGAEAI